MAGRNVNTNTIWSVPKMWEGQTCVILAGGKSLSDEQVETARSTWPYARTIAINNSYQRAPWADMLYAADLEWWTVYREEASKFQGYKVSIVSVPDTAAVPNCPFPWLLRLRTGPMNGFVDDPTTIATGGNSGYQAICVAALTGATRVLLCGYDMHGEHWHKPHKLPLRVTRQEQYGAWLDRFATLKKPLAERGVEVINCSPKSALKVWPYMPLAEALALAEVRV